MPSPTPHTWLWLNSKKLRAAFFVRRTWMVCMKPRAQPVSSISTESCLRAAAPVVDFEGYAPQNLPRCGCGALMRPNVCWFGEQPYELERIYSELERCTTFLAIGTSGFVQPVASFVSLLKQRQQARTIYVGLTEPANAAQFDHVYLGSASVVVPQVLGTLRCGGLNCLACGQIAAVICPEASL